MTIRQTQIAIGITPTAIYDPGIRHIVDPALIALRNGGTASIFLGGTNVDVSGTNGGFELTAGSVMVGTFLSGDALYGIVVAGTQTLQVMRLRQPN